MTGSNALRGRAAALPELLAPAGNKECLHAAVRGGADAVYLGLDEFNARRNAGNFSLESLGQACDYAHLRGVSVYVAMNIAVLPSELERACGLAREAHAAGADAFIVQDVGLAAELHRRLPSAEIHISTQANTHNAAGIAAAAALGASRVTLARELSLGEIAELAALAADMGMEVECFAHGALCVCYSGQCLMSSMIGGRSANRGLCAQACRLPYDLRGDAAGEALPSPGEHLLSPRDLCTVGILDDLAEAGVASLKVEGRMKSADYVGEVVSVYREVLDSGLPPTEAHRARLAEAFSRGFTEAYLVGERGNGIMSYGRPNNRGVFAGRVVRCADGVAGVKPEIDLHDGDVLEFWTNRGHFAATVRDAGCASDGAVDVPVDQRTRKGDRVFRVRNARTAFQDDAFEPRVPIRGTAEVVVGKPLRVSLETGEGAAYRRVDAYGDVVEAARTRPVSEADVVAHLDRLGQTPFAFGKIDAVVGEGAGVGFSQIHRVRAEAVERLQDTLLAPYRERATAFGASGASRTGVAERPGRQGGAGRGERACEVYAWATSPGTARIAKRQGADAIFVPLLNFRRGQSQVAGVLQADAEQAGYPKQCLMALPAVDHDPVAPRVSGRSGRTWSPTREYASAFDPWDYVREGKRVFADSLGGALRALELGAVVELGPHVPVTNRASLRLIAEMGVARVWLSPELTLGQIADLADESPVPLGLYVAGAQELMITEHCLLMSQGPCAESCETCARRSTAHRLVDRKGFEFPVVTDMLGRSHLYNGIDLDAVHALPDLVDMGVSAVMVDTTLLDRKAASDAVSRVVRACKLAVGEGRAVGKRPNTTTGHLFRGVS